MTALDWLLGISLFLIVLATGQRIIDFAAGPDPDLRETWYPDADYPIPARPPARERRFMAYAERAVAPETELEKRAAWGDR